MRWTIFILLLLVLSGCNGKKNSITDLQNRIDSLESKLYYPKNGEHLSQSVLWFQHAPEMHALYVQSFNIAKKALADNLKRKTDNSKRNAIVVDIDETILNNSLYQGWLYSSNSTYTDSTWNVWVHDTIAKPLPGAVDFLKFAEQKGCEIFYVSNRNHEFHFEATLLNLRKYNLPYADEKHILLKTESDTLISGQTTKEKRRLTIEGEHGYEIVLLCGDQIADFDRAFDYFKGGNEEHIIDSINKYKDSFGSRYVIVPNPVYSDWLNKIITGENKNCSNPDSLRNTKIVSWK